MSREKAYLAVVYNHLHKMLGSSFLLKPMLCWIFHVVGRRQNKAA